MDEKLVKGIAYHGNRMIPHIKDDMREIVSGGFNTVLHMFTHNDWLRHKNIMKEKDHTERNNDWNDKWTHFLKYFLHIFLQLK